MKLPLIFFITASYILGIILGSHLRISLFLNVAVLTVALVLMVPFRRRYFTLLGLALLCFVLLGVLMVARVDRQLAASLLSRQAGSSPVTIKGIVISEPRQSGAGYSFSFNVHSWESDEGTVRTNERLKVMVRGEILPGLDYGRALKIVGQPMFPRQAANESFDYARYLYYQRIRLIFRTSPDGIEFAKTPGVLNGVVVASRYRIKRLTQRVLENDSAGLMLGILLGDTSDISSGLQDDFKATGLTHILAVSGLNVAMLLVICLFILRILRLRPHWQVILAASILGYYALITRGEPSVLRATIMALVGLGGWYLGRQKNLLSALSFAALLLLVYDPFLLYSVSFQLSFAATLALIVFCPILVGRLEGLRLPGWVKDGVAVSLAAQLGVLPILAYYFNQVSLISLLANVLVVPATAPVLALGLAASALSWVSGALSHFTLYLSSLFLNYMITATHLLARIPWAAVDVSSPSFLQAGVYYLVVGVSMHALSLKKRGWDRKVLLLALFIVALVFWFRVLGNAPPSRLEATFFAVGQGDAALVRTPGGANILIDGGENPSYMRRALVRKRVGRLDLVILSHPHADHVGGLPEVIRSKNVDTVFDAAQVHSAPGYVDFLRAVRERKVRYKKVRAGKTFKIGDELTLRILHPTEELVSGSISDLNNNSLVTRISYGKVSLLFSGDIEREGEENLLSHRGRSGLKSTVIKVPHHGSANGSDLGFLKAVAPRLAVISVGKGNSFGHPAKVTLKRLRSLGSRVYRTDRTGDVTIVTDGKEVAVKTQR